MLVLGALTLGVTAASIQRDRANEREAVPTAVVTGEPMTCMPDPAACGFPDVSSTGVTPGTPLTPVSGTVTLSSPGQVLENRLVTGQIVVTAPNVTIRNVKLVATDDAYGIESFSWEHNTTGLTLDHVEIDLNGHFDVKGIAFDNYTASHLFIHNGSDCAHMGDNATITDSLCAVGPDANGDGWADAGFDCHDGPHYDGFQSDGGSNLTIRHNTIRNPCGQTSAILMSTNTEPIDHVTIDANLMAGGGYTVYCGTDEGGVAAGETYTNNVISREYFRNGGRWGPTTTCDKVAVARGNMWDGSFVPGGTPPRGAGAPAAATLSATQARRSALAALKRRLGRRFTRRSPGLRVTCHRRSATIVTCTVKWRRRSGGRTLDSYSGTVTVARLSATRRRYGYRIRHWARGCSCARTLKGTGASR